jgi:hypothetical protein
VATTGLNTAKEGFDAAEAGELRLANAATTVVFGALAILVATSFGWVGWPSRWVMLVGALLFVPLSFFRVRAARARQRAGYVVDWIAKADARAGDNFDFGQPDGAEYVGRDHEYAYDLDLFGPHSVFERLNACHTGLGRNALAAMLLNTNDVTDLSAPQSAVRELVAKVDAREALEVELRALIERAGRGVDELAGQTHGLVQWARGPSPEPPAPWIPAAAVVLPFLSVAGIGVWLGLQWPWWTAAAPYALNLFVATRLKDMGSLMGVFEGVRRTLSSWADTVEAAATFEFDSAPLRDTVGRLGSEHAPDTIRQLGTLADGLSQRRNAFWAMTGNVVLLSDVRARNALARWHQEHGEHLASWMEAVAELEAWSSLAAHAESHAEPVWPEAATDGAMVEAVEIAHPLLPRAGRVGNTGTLTSAGATWVVTGSNMSGKSTFLRALGLGVVFARLGLPVSARSLRIRDLRVVTSMKVEESLHAGSSRFHAEVQRLRRCLDWAAEGPSLVLLDEILGGTNSAERRLGTVAVLERLRSLDAVTLVSTHDLGLSDVLDLWTTETRVVHFTDRIEDGQMIFDYRIKDGRLPSTNALEVMRAEGIPVDVHRAKTDP